MASLAIFELSKLWRSRAFLMTVAALLAVNILALWYSHPGISSYRRLREDISGLEGEEKYEYIASLKETIDGVSFVEDILLMRRTEIGAKLAQDELASRPGVFQEYYPLYASGEYLRYTGTLAEETAFVEKLYGEARRVAGYGEYLRDIETKSGLLGGISIFSGGGFTARNIEKSAADHAPLTDRGVSYVPYEPVALAAGSVWTDIFLILLTSLSAGLLTTQERQMGLWAVSRATYRGGVPSALGKLAALFINALALEAMFFASNVIFSGVAAGWWDLGLRVQSVSVYMESALDISLLEFYLLSALAKGLALFAASALLMALCCAFRDVTAPYFAAGAAWCTSWALWRFLPAASKLSAVKYLNVFALLRTETIFGAYLNFNIAGTPVSRTDLSLELLLCLLAAGSIVPVPLYCRAGALNVTRRRWAGHFRPHDSLLRHESYKLLIANRGLAVLILFACLIGARGLSVSYAPSPGEMYYRDIMMRLQAPLTEEGEALINTERARFEDAFEELRRIEAAQAAGELQPQDAAAMSAPWQAVTAFYPEFQRVLGQYERVRASGGEFLYDTGWLYLLGVYGAGEMPGYMLVTLGLVLALSNAGTVELSNGVWGIVRAALAGRRKVLGRKCAVCAAAGAILGALPMVFRFFSVTRSFPVGSPLAGAGALSASLPSALPVAALAAGKLALDMSCGAALGLAVLGVSFWRGSHAGAIIFAAAILAGPCVLYSLGLQSAAKFSLYPVFSWHPALGVVTS